MEYKFNKFLSGKPGKIILDSDPRGYRIISGQKQVVEYVYDGGHIYTTLDAYIQYLSREYLKQSIEENEAEKGTVIVMNPRTGEILAMVNYPDFDPDNWAKSQISSYKNLSVTDMYEPGSVFKIVANAGVLEENLIPTNQVIYVPETLQIGRRTIREAHRRPNGESAYKNMTEIFSESLNVGTSILAQNLGEPKFYNYMKKFGFGCKTNVEFPGESTGLLRPPQSWSNVDLAMMSFGQGIAVTPLQIAAAVCVIANNGELLKPCLVKYFSDKNYININSVQTKKIRQVISPKNAQEITQMMVDVVENGTGVPAKINGMLVAGKTGTAQIPRPDGLGYLPNQWVTSFVGFFPAQNPQILILVKVDSPKKISGDQPLLARFLKISRKN